MVKPIANIAIVGAGPAGLMAADVLSAQGARVSLYERMPTAARKFLLAGRGGLNITHSEDLERLLTRYGSATAHLREAIEAFAPSAVRTWCEGLGEATFVGSSGRVFPKSFKTSPLLRSLLRRLDGRGVRFAFRHRWTGWDERGDPLFETPQGPLSATCDALILALGGASWPRLGSDGSWVETLAKTGVAVAPLRPANCGFAAAWSTMFRDKFHGHPLKRIALTFAGHTARGEAMITREGLEGGAVYGLSAPLRDAIAADGSAILTIALRPDLSQADLQSALDMPRAKQSLSNVLRKTAKLSPAAIGLLNEAGLASGQKLVALEPPELAKLINAVPVRLTAPMPLATAISTAGGIAFDEIDNRFMLRHRPGVFIVGEMLDWEAPTGGYLLQASLSTGAAAALGALEWVRAKRA